MERSIQKPGSIAWLFAAVAAMAAALLFPFFALVAPAFGAYALRRSNAPAIAALPLVAAPVVLAFALSDSGLSPYMLALLVSLPAVVIERMQAHRRGGFETCLAAAAIFVALLYAAVCLPGILSGEGAFAAVQRLVDETVSVMRGQLAAVTTPETAALIETYDAYLDTASRQVEALTVPVLCSVGCALALSNTLFFRLFSKGRRAALGLAPLSPFSRWSVPKSFTIGLFVLYLGSMLLSLTGSAFADGVRATVSALVAFPMIVQGLALLDFFICRRPGSPTTRRILLYTAIGLLFPLAQSGLVMIGCFEQIFRLRERNAAAPTPSAGV